jgi:hypothetical protein
MTRRIYPYATGPRSYVDPAGHDVHFDYVENPEVERDLYLEISQSTLATFKEIWEMAHMASWGPDARNHDGSWTTPARS